MNLKYGFEIMYNFIVAHSMCMVYKLFKIFSDTLKFV